MVGAGPGDPGLLTDKGRGLLEIADTIVYDRLIENCLLNHVNERCEMIYVGKEPGRHKLSQEEINHILVEKAVEGKTIVRLKGGDPYLFGRGGEEADYLRKENISFEVVPGITSALAVPAYAGIPVTSRKFSSSVAIITGHEDPEKEKSSHNWKALAEGPETLVFLMGVKNLPKIQRKLLDNGKDGDTPAAVIEKGTMPEQRTVYSDLNKIAHDAEKEEIRPPAVIIVGDVVKLGKKLRWRVEKPLSGLRIINTRPKDQAGGFTKMLESQGAVVREVPAIKIAPPEDHSELDLAFEKILSYDWILFTSTNGVRYFFDRMGTLKFDIRILKDIKLATIGEKTASELEKKGLYADFVPEDYSGEDLLLGLKEKLDEKQRILLPRTPRARELLADGLREAGHEVDEVEAYRTLGTSLPKDVERDIDEGIYDLITFTSSSTVENFLEMIGDKGRLEDMITASIGPVTADTARKNGVRVDIVASRYDIEGLYDAILNHYMDVSKTC